MQVYLHIYNTYSTNTTLLPLRAHGVEMTSMWHHHVTSTSVRRNLDVMCLLGVTKTGVWKVVRPWKWNLPCSVRCILTKFGHKLLLSLSAQPDYMWTNWEKIIARTLCFMHQSFFRPNYIFDNDAYFLDFRSQKFPLIFLNVNPFHINKPCMLVF